MNPVLTCLPPLSKQSSSLSNWIGLFERQWSPFWSVKDYYWFNLKMLNMGQMVTAKNIEFCSWQSYAADKAMCHCQAYRNETATDYGSTRSHTCEMLVVDLATISSLDSIRHALFNLDLLWLDLLPTILLCSQKHFKDKKNLAQNSNKRWQRY